MMRKFLPSAHTMRTLLIAVTLSSLAILDAGTAPQSYLQSIHEWQAHRNKGLRSADGWLTLVGLFWLEPGHAQSIGSSSQADFTLPQNAPPLVGKLLLKDKNITFTNLSGAAVTVDGKPVSGSVKLSFDEKNPSIVRAGSISFFAIQREDRLAIRARDSDSAVLRTFPGMHYFPINPELHFAQAKLIPDVKKIPILNIVGQTEMQESPGIVEFVYKRTTYRLRPIYEGKTLFFLFKDPTNKTQTYQAGRMLNTPLPVNNTVDLDFNRSYTPPCTFTPYATCPLPPRINNLPIPINAGELRYNKGRSQD